MEQIIDFVGSRFLRSKLDLRDAYHNLRIHHKSVKDAIFCCHIGKYDLLVMQQGDCKVSATMMRAMNALFSNIKHHIIHLNDILIVNYTHEDDINMITGIMKIPKDNLL